MNTYKRHRFRLGASTRYHQLCSLALPSLQSQARGNSHRDIEDLIAERGITVSYETIRLWHPKHSLRSWGRLCIKFGSTYTKRLKRKHRGYGDTFYIEEVFVKINGKQHYLWRAVDQDGEVVDVFLQPRRDGASAKRFFKRLLRSHGGEPRKVVTDKLRSYGVAHRELIPETIHVTERYANNRAEQPLETQGPNFFKPEALTCRYPQVG
jgi:putative transposase